MPRKCSVCGHEQRQAIDRALIDGESFRNIAERFGTSVTALTRHKASHLPERMTRAKRAEEVSAADDLLKHSRALWGKATSLLVKAETAGDLRTALQGVREARGCLELYARLSGELNDQRVTNIVMSPQWTVVYNVIVKNLAPYPELRATIADNLLALGAGDDRS